MAIVVNTYADESLLEAAIGGTVTTFSDESTLEAGIALASSADFIVAKGQFYTLCDTPTLANIVTITGKGIFFTVTSGTP